MINIKRILKEAVRRVTLKDLIEDNKETTKLIDDLDYERKWYRKVTYSARNGSRAGLRVIGDIELACAGFYASSVEPEKGFKYMLIGVIGFFTFYLLDHLLYDKLNIMNPYKQHQDRKKVDD